MRTRLLEFQQQEHLSMRRERVSERVRSAAVYLALLQRLCQEEVLHVPHALLALGIVPQEPLDTKHQSA